MGYVLVIGSVLLDMIGIYDDCNDISINKPGLTEISVGGVAFNIAANLAENNIDSKLVTCLKPDTISAEMIRFAIKNSKIDDQYVFENNGIIEPGYVAIMDKNRQQKDPLVLGVTSSPIENVDLTNAIPLERAISNASLVAIETNLKTTQIQKISEFCCKYNKPLLVNVVADTKTERIYNKKFSSKFEVVCLNFDEAMSVGINVNNCLNELQVIEICKKFNSNWIFITRGRKGYHILRCDGSSDFIDSQIDVVVVNSLGAGDALFSALCLSVYKQKPLDGIETQEIIKEWVTQILVQKEANMGPKGFKKDQPHKNFKIKSITLMVYLCLSVISMLVGTFIKNITPLFFGICLFSCSIFSGALGALIREGQRNKFQEKNLVTPIVQPTIYGMIAGLVAALINALPHLSVGKTALTLRTDVNDLNLLIIFSFIISLGAGLCCESIFNNIKLLPTSHSSEQININKR